MLLIRRQLGKEDNLSKRVYCKPYIANNHGYIIQRDKDIKS